MAVTVVSVRASKVLGLFMLVPPVLLPESWLDLRGVLNILGLTCSLLDYAGGHSTE